MGRLAYVLLLYGLCAAVSTQCIAAFEELDPFLVFTGRGLLQRSLNCRSVHKACNSCRTARIPGTRRTELVCSVCDAGWRLRRDGKAKTCDCAPGFSLTGSLSDPTSRCDVCPLGSYCLGGDAANPRSLPTQCPSGLATVSAGAKSPAQCFTKPGFGRSSARGANGAVQLQGQQCPVGTYNIGSNTAGCFRCNPGLTTLQTGSDEMTDCVAPPGSYYDRGIGRLCPQGTYSDTYSSADSTDFCIACNNGVTTASEGSPNSSDCSYAQPGYYMSAEGEAQPCPVNTYSDQVSNATSCTACPFGMRTQLPGATGVAQCLAPPGYELMADAAEITECAIGYYKQDWNRNNCTACGVGLITGSSGSISRDACLVPAGWGLTSLFPMAAVPCTNNSYGIDEDRPVSTVVRCVTCAPNMFTEDVLTGTLTPAGTGYTGETSCRVAPGWGTTQSDMVERCPKGFYNPGNNRQPCRKCPLGYTTLDIGSVDSSACVIQPGWAFDTNQGAPMVCPVGTFSIGGTADVPNAECTPCPDGSTTQTDESTSSDDCGVCRAGYGGTGCQLCSYGTWSSGNLLAGSPCVPCASGSVSPRGATGPEQCYPEMQMPVRDMFQLSNDSYWQTVTATSDSACSQACSRSSSCIQFRWGQGLDQPCQILNEFTGTDVVTQYIAFKLQLTSDYAVYQVPADLTVGVLVGAAPGQRTFQQCMRACSQSNKCELVSFPMGVEFGDCVMYGSELDSEYFGMFHVQGSKIMSM